MKCVKEQASPAETPAAVMKAWKPASCKEVCGLWPARAASLIQKANTSTALTFLDLHSMAPDECIASCNNFQKSLSTCVATIMFDQGRIAAMAGKPPAKGPKICETQPETPLEPSPCFPNLPIQNQMCAKHRTAKILEPSYEAPEGVAQSCKLIAEQMDECKDCPQLQGGYQTQYVAFTGGCMDQLNAYWTASNYGVAGEAALPSEQGCRVHTAAQIKAAAQRKAAEEAAAAAAKKAAELALAKKKAAEALAKKKALEEAARKLAKELADAKAAAVAAKKKAEAAAAAKKAAAALAAKRKAAAAAAKKKKAEDAAAAKRKAEAAAAAKKKAAEALAKKKAQEAAAKKRAEELAKKLADAKAAAAAAKKKAAEAAAAKKAAEAAAAKKAAEAAAKAAAAAAAVKAAEAKAAAARVAAGTQIANHGGWKFYKVATSSTDDAGIKATCTAKGLVTPCAGPPGCTYNAAGCTLTSEKGCGSPMSTTSRKICGGRNPSACAPLKDTYTFMGFKWVSACGTNGRSWCVVGNKAKAGYAFCAKRA